MPPKEVGFLHNGPRGPSPAFIPSEEYGSPISKKDRLHQVSNPPLSADVQLEVVSTQVYAFVGE